MTTSSNASMPPLSTPLSGPLPGPPPVDGPPQGTLPLGVPEGQAVGVVPLPFVAVADGTVAVGGTVAGGGMVGVVGVVVVVGAPGGLGDAVVVAGGTVVVADGVVVVVTVPVGCVVVAVAVGDVVLVEVAVALVCDGITTTLLVTVRPGVFPFANTTIIRQHESNRPVIIMKITLRLRTPPWPPKTRAIFLQSCRIMTPSNCPDHKHPQGSSGQARPQRQKHGC